MCDFCVEAAAQAQQVVGMLPLIIGYVVAGWRSIIAIAGTARAWLH